jgi:hypothetical integral membrane protein (TIGR02206 family)
LLLFGSKIQVYQVWFLVPVIAFCFFGKRSYFQNSLQKMKEHYVIELFSPLWWQGLVLSLTAMAVLLLGGWYGNEKMKAYIATTFGVMLLSMALFSPLFQWIRGDWTVQSSLPLNLCSLSAFLSGIVLLWRSQLAYEMLLYWGLSGATYSLITPEMTLGYSDWNLIDYYISHAGILFSALYLSLVCGLRPRAGSWRKAFLLTQIVALAVGIIDKLIGANYMYLMQKPTVSNPFFAVDWPWYILVLEVALLLHFYVIYLLFRSPKIKTAETAAT